MELKVLQKLKTDLSQPKNIIIVTHKNPDGDAMGSSLGLYNYLFPLKHKVVVITPNEYPENLHWLPGNNKVVVFENKRKKADELIKKADFVFCLDFNSLQRIDELGEVVRKSKARKIVIDHHQEPEDFAEILFSDTKASSTAQLIFDFIEMLGDIAMLNKSIANCLYTGIMTDTGSFRFPSTVAKTHYTIARLIEAGAENASIYDLVNDNNTESRLRLLGYCLSEKLKVFAEFGTAFFTLSWDEMVRYDYKNGDTEGVVNYALSIKGIKFAAFFSEKEDLIRISFRSKGNFAVNQFSKNHFNGGGHINAAGGASEESLDDTISKFISLLPQYKKQILKA